jgi:hypothetical protein
MSTDDYRLLSDRPCAKQFCVILVNLRNEVESKGGQRETLSSAVLFVSLRSLR